MRQYRLAEFTTNARTAAVRRCGREPLYIPGSVLPDRLGAKSRHAAGIRSTLGLGAGNLPRRSASTSAKPSVVYQVASFLACQLRQVLSRLGSWVSIVALCRLGKPGSDEAKMYHSAVMVCRLWLTNSHQYPYTTGLMICPAGVSVMLWKLGGELPLRRHSVVHDRQFGPRLPWRERKRSLGTRPFGRKSNRPGTTNNFPPAARCSDTLHERLRSSGKAVAGCLRPHTIPAFRWRGKSPDRPGA